MTVLSTYAEIHATVIGVAVGGLIAVVSGFDSGHADDTRDELAYFSGGCIAGYVLTKIGQRYVD